MKNEKEEKNDSLDNLKWEMFCREYVKPGDWFLNGGHAYAVVYGLDYGKDNAQCRANAARLITNDNIMGRIMSFLSEGGLNDATVANRLKEILLQTDDKGASLKAMDLYYKYIKRIGEKLEVSGEISGITINVKRYDNKKTEQK